MRILLISDIHANLTALKAVIEKAKPFEMVYCLGDLVGYGPDPNECIELVRAFPSVVCLAGNHDLAALESIDTTIFNSVAAKAVEWTASQLTSENKEFLKSLPPKKELATVTLVHGSPRNPIWEYIEDRYSAAVAFDSMNGNVCFCGHTHIPAVFSQQLEQKKVVQEPIKDHTTAVLNDRLILNPGSVGQPRDGDSRASFAILDTELNQVKLQRVSYDIDSVQKRIEQFGLPSSLARRLKTGHY